MLAIALTTNPRSQTTANHLGDDVAKAGASWRERSGGRAQTGRTEAVNTFGCTFDGHTVARCRRSVPAQLQEKTVQVCAFAWEACPVINSPALRTHVLVQRFLIMMMMLLYHSVVKPTFFRSS